MSEARGHKSPDGRIARGESTRANVLESALPIFASRGFSDVTTRELADAAGANQAAIVYHFGSKEGLYLAVAELVAERAGAALRSALDDVGTRAPAEDPDVPPAVATLRTALRALTRGFITMSANSAVTAFVVREQAHPGLGFDILYRQYIGEMHTRISTLVAGATGRAVADRTVIVDAHALIGMALSFSVARATVLRRLGAPQYSARQATLIADRVAELGCQSLGLISSAAPTASTSRRTARR